MRDVVLDSTQLQAVDLLRNAPIGIVTGGAGTGKTTVLKEALKTLPNFELCAPTGKAARRMQEVTNREARTIHRLLGWQQGKFAYGPGVGQLRLPTDVVICDEASMVDIRLCADLTGALDTGTRIIFVGDVNQLPPVGPGAPFRDMINSNTVPVVRLEQQHRAAAERWVYRNAPKVLTGGPIETDDIADFTWYQLGKDDAHHISDVVCDVLREELSKGTPLDDFQVISPMKVRAGGANELNRALQKSFNPTGMRGSGWRVDDETTIFVGDRVMQTKNDYILDVFNGEVGVVKELTAFYAVIEFDAFRTIRYSHTQALGLQLAYACSIHRFQGSQCPHVVVVCHSSQSRMLTRQLFYTAITRAQNRVILVGDRGGLETALATSKDVMRRTRLAERIKTGLV